MPKSFKLVALFALLLTACTPHDHEREALNAQACAGGPNQDADAIEDYIQGCNNLLFTNSADGTTEGWSNAKLYCQRAMYKAELGDAEASKADIVKANQHDYKKEFGKSCKLPHKAKLAVKSVHDE